MVAEAPHKQGRSAADRLSMMPHTYLPQHVQPLHNLHNGGWQATHEPWPVHYVTWSLWRATRPAAASRAAFSRNQFGILAANCQPDGTTHLADHHMLAVALRSRSKRDIELRRVAVLACSVQSLNRTACGWKAGTSMAVHQLPCCNTPQQPHQSWQSPPLQAHHACM